MDIHRKISQLDIEFTRRFAQRTWWIFKNYYRAQVNGVETMPREAFVGVGNHGGAYLAPECFVFGAKYYATPNTHPMLMLAHDLFVKMQENTLPVFRRMGLIKANYQNALRALDANYSIMVYPGGDREIAKPFAERKKIDFYGHKGYVRLALESGKPIVPVVSTGGHETSIVLWDGSPIAKGLMLDKLFKVNVFPLVWSFPSGLNLGAPKFALPLPAQISVQVLPAIRLQEYTPDDARNSAVVDAIDAEVRFKMQKALNKLSEGRIPFLGKMK